MAGKDDGYIRFQCHSCGKRLKVRKKYEGGSVVPCPVCRASVLVPLANLEAIARKPQQGADDEWLDRLNVQPDALRERLATPDIPVSDLDLVRPAWRQKHAERTPDATAGPSLNLPTRAFERIQQLDSMSARIKQIEDECVGDIQRMFRNADITAQQRERRATELADGRRRDIRRAFEDVLAAVRHDLKPLMVNISRLSREELDRRENLEAAEEAIKLYAHNVYGLDV